MNDLAEPILHKHVKQIIPDQNAVVSCFDSEIIEILDSHSTFTINELLRTIRISGVDRTSFRDSLRDLIVEMQKESHNVQSLLNKLTTFINGEAINENRYTSYEILRKALLNGTDCNLLQADGQGWQKGQLKVCFEFIPDGTESVASQNNPTETHPSPLDEIRNSLVESN
jgi:glucose-6-phosphate-specific signal transduction histidine kinase